MAPGTTSGKAESHPIPYDETYYILRGQARVEFGGGEESYDVTPGTAVFIAAGTKHKITNIGTDDLTFLTIWPLQPGGGRRQWGLGWTQESLGDHLPQG